MMQRIQPRFSAQECKYASNGIRRCYDRTAC